MCCSEYTETHTCGKRDSFNSLILGGEETVPGEWPWAVILQFTDDDMRCGGVLISSRHVLTAAHCVVGGLEGAVLGEHDLDTHHDCLDPDYGCHHTGPQCLADQLCAPPSQMVKATVRLVPVSRQIDI